MFQATREIERVFEEKELQYEVLDHGDLSILRFPFAGENIKVAAVSFISADDNNDVAIRVMNLGVVSESKIPRVLSVLNHLNNTHRYLKFVMDESRMISIQYDLPESSDNVGTLCFELVHRFMQVVDEAYPELMRAIWA